MGPLLFYFTPKGFSEDTARSLILYQKWQTDLSSNLNCQTVKSVDSKCLQCYVEKDLDA